MHLDPRVGELETDWPGFVRGIRLQHFLRA